MPTHDLARWIDLLTWYSLENCINESLNVIDEDEFLAKTGRTRDAAKSLHALLDQGPDMHPALDDADIDLARRCALLATELVDDWEFNLRVGFDKDDALRLAATLSALLPAP